MSPEVAEAIRQQTSCDYCGAGVGDRCVNTLGEPTSWVHDRRVQSNLFRRPTQNGAS